MQIIENSKEYDVCVIGSGAGGGMAAKVLTEAGAEVIMLEAGPWFDSEDYTMFKWPYQSPRRGAPTDRPFGEFDAAFGGWELDGEPYTHVADTKFDWFRSRMLGGRTNHWGRIALRFGPDDFKAESKDGFGTDWPVTYDEIQPYYDKVDQLIGVFGSPEGIRNEPDGKFLPPPKPRCYELFIKQGADRLNIPMIPSRLAILTESIHGRPPCHYCSQCNRSCSTHSNFSSPSVLIPPAQQTGRLKIVNNAMAREVMVGKDGLANGVSYVNKEDSREYKVRAKVVVLAASSCESARLLLNSKSSLFPDGLANSSGVVGKYLMDSTGTSVAGVFPQLLDPVPHNEDGTGGMHLYIPWWLDNNKLDFPRGYHVELWGGQNMPSYGFMGGIQNYNGDFPSEYGTSHPNGGGGYGKQLKDDYRRFYGSMLGFAGRGETIARKDNYCEIDPNVVDKYGIPVLRFHYTWSDHEYNQVKHMQETFRSLIEELGGKALSPMPGREDGYGIEAPGRIIHEVGTVRMGNDPKTSVLNKYSQAHDVKNLFVMDGGPFVSQPHKNPTLTILTFAMRASEYLVDQRKKLNV